MRDVRNTAARLPNAGWHFSWLGNASDWDTKQAMFCHTWAGELVVKDGETNYQQGVHTDGTKLLPVTVDDTWPAWMLVPGNVPADWYRP